MPRLIIRTWLGTYDGASKWQEWEQTGSPVRYDNGGGHASVIELRRELRRRNTTFGQPKWRLENIPGGLRFTPAHGRTVDGMARQEVTLVD